MYINIVLRPFIGVLYCSNCNIRGAHCGNCAKLCLLGSNSTQADIHCPAFWAASVYQSKTMTLKLVTDDSLRKSVSSFQMTRSNCTRYSNIQQNIACKRSLLYGKNTEIWIIHQTTDNRIFGICLEKNSLLPLSHFKSSESHLFFVNRCIRI
jgi:hypothetical protein